MLCENQLSAEASEARKKAEAQAARIKLLEQDLKGKREKLLLLLQKSDSDDQLVQARHGTEPSATECNGV